MKPFFLSATAFFALALIAATSHAQNGGVAVLDIDEVARRLGVEEKVRTDLLSIQNQLNQELQQSQNALQNQMVGVERAAGENPTEEQRRNILATNQQLNAEFNRLRGQAEGVLAQERIRLINEFRIALEPIAMQAAESMGLKVVLMKVTPPVFTYSSEVDITDATTEFAIEAGMNVEAPAAPSESAAPSAPEETAPAPSDDASDAPAPAPENP